MVFYYCMWISEILGIFAICNAAIFTDLFYKVVTTSDVEPTYFQDSNFIRSRHGIEDRCEIISKFWSWLCFLSSVYGVKREESVKLYRGVGFRIEKKYEKGKNYRFVTFQNCSRIKDRARKFLTGEDNAFYTIILPNHWKNGFSISKNNNDDSSEHLIIPFTRFKLNPKKNP